MFIAYTDNNNKISPKQHGNKSSFEQLEDDEEVYNNKMGMDNLNVENISRVQSRSISDENDNNPDVP